jgi:hypothetical protein
LGLGLGQRQKTTRQEKRNSRRTKIKTNYTRTNTRFHLVDVCQATAGHLGGCVPGYKHPPRHTTPVVDKISKANYDYR